ncbi:HHR101Wp [Eremothecium sinecaudum]|uniref:HHR101Wp n=1 Tax=Eremothecium sinecaudum TaxID=45286 RepID=A0A0X8HWQ2_9SACH|nr:HHR101Wp [Eremothecium sinecaudum]AMD22870.1 HHR101Wp [Eremothecium sinecaudum]
MKLTIWSLLIFLTPLKALAKVQSIKSVDQFYDIVDNDANYTLVKYYTTWCSHCKRLAPVYDKLSETLPRELGDDYHIEFLEVDCDKFDRALCSRLPGFPVVELVKPLRTAVNDDDSGREKEKEKDDPEPEALGLFDWVWSFWPFGSSHKKHKELDTSRIREYQGIRSTEALTSFVKTAIDYDRYNALAEQVLDNTAIKHTGSPIIEKARIYVASLGADLSSEREKVYKTLKDSTSEQDIEYARLQLHLVNKLAESQETAIHDEL